LAHQTAVPRHFIIATAGHVDHGKSSLVKALTGTDPDRLPEEKARGITLDLGFAHLELRSPHDPSFIFNIGIVDVPGHENLVKNMVSGVGSIDLALFVVAADDGWMPQTEEHLQIITYLGVTRAVVAITKTDLVQFAEDAAVAQIDERLRGTPLASAPIVKTSIVTGRGIEELKDTLRRVLQDAPPQQDIGKPRLPVDRAFTLPGIGTVVTGTLTGGTLRRGQEVVVWPSGKNCRIRTIQSHGSQVEFSGPATRTALNLPDLVISSDLKEGIKRGSIVTTADLGTPSYTLDVLLDRSARLAADKSAPVRALKDGTVIRWHCGSANVPARLLGDWEELAAGTRGVGQLRFDSPVFVLAGEKFILRDWSEQVTLAGGVVLDADADRKSFRNDKRRRFLQQRSDSVSNVLSFVDSQLARDGAVNLSGLLVKTLFSLEHISQSVSQRANEGKVIIAGDLVVEIGTWTMLRESMVRAIDREHEAHPERLGLSLSELRASIEPISPLPEIVHALTAALCAKGFQRVGTFIRRKTHRPALPSDLHAAGQRVRSALDDNPFEPPSRNQLAPDPLAQKALRFLLETGEAIEISDDVVLSSQALRQIIAIVQKTLQDSGSATTSELRKAIGTSRRIAVPLLEFLDRNGITRREGDKRVLP
jgi:selenocysteine-specific elongation factor